MARLWDGSTGEHLSTLKGHSGPIWSVAFSPDSRQVATGSKDKTAQLWNGSTGEHVSTLEGHSGPIWSVAFSPDSCRVTMGSLDNTVRLWDAAMEQGLQTIKNAQFFSPTFLFFISSDSPCVLQDFCGRPLCWFANDFSIEKCLFSPNERFVVITTTRNQVLTIDLSSISLKSLL